MLWTLSGKVTRTGENIYILATAGPQLPDQMASPVLVTGTGQISVSAPVPPDLNGGSLIEYMLRISTDENAWTEVVVTTFPWVFSGLANGVAYFIQQTVRTDAGIGPWSISAIATPTASGAVAPAKPQPPQMTPGNGQITFDLPENSPNGGSAITSENIRYGASATGPWTTRSAVADPYVQTGLSNGQNYWGQCQTVNAIGASPWSDSLGPIRPEAPPSGYPTPDVTLDNTALIAKLNEYKANWNSTIPAGKTATSERYIAVRSGKFGTLTLSNYSFPAKVHIVSADMVGLGAEYVGVFVSGCTRLGFDFITTKRDALPSGNNPASEFTSCNSCWFNLGAVIGPPDEVAVKKPFGMIFKTCNDMEFCENLILHQAVGFKHEGGSGLIRRGNVYDFMKGDDAKTGGQLINQLWKDEWGSLTKQNYNPSDHTDYFQDQSGANTDPPGPSTDNLLAEGLVIYQKTPNDRSFQAVYFGGRGLRTNYRVRDSWICASNEDVKYKIADGYLIGDASNLGEYVTALYPPPWDDGRTADATPLTSLPDTGNVDGGGGTVRKNIVSKYSSTSPASLGTGSIRILIEGTKGASNYDHQHDYYTGPITRLAPHASRSPLSEMRPIAGTPAHWDHASPVGAFNRLREIFVEGKHPGNSLNRVMAAHWQAHWNYDHAVSS